MELSVPHIALDPSSMNSTIGAYLDCMFPVGFGTLMLFGTRLFLRSDHSPKEFARRLRFLRILGAVMLIIGVLYDLHGRVAGMRKAGARSALECGGKRQRDTAFARTGRTRTTTLLPPAEPSQSGVALTLPAALQGAPCFAFVQQDCVNRIMGRGSSLLDPTQIESERICELAQHYADYGSMLTR